MCRRLFVSIGAASLKKILINKQPSGNIFHFSLSLRRSSLFKEKGRGLFGSIGAASFKKMLLTNSYLAMDFISLYRSGGATCL